MKLLIVLFATVAVASAGFDLRWFSFPFAAPATTTTTKAPTTTTQPPVATTTTTKAPEVARQGQLPSGTLEALHSIFNLYPDLAEHQDEIVNSPPSSEQSSLANGVETLSPQIQGWIQTLQNYIQSVSAGSVDLHHQVAATR